MSHSFQNKFYLTVGWKILAKIPRKQICQAEWVLSNLGLFFIYSLFWHIDKKVEQ